MEKSTAVTQLASCEARYTAAQAMSSASANRLNIVLRRAASRMAALFRLRLAAVLQGQLIERARELDRRALDQDLRGSPVIAADALPAVRDLRRTEISQTATQTSPPVTRTFRSLSAASATSAMATRAPHPASRHAIDCPNRLLPPVTSATLPLYCIGPTLNQACPLSTA